MQNILHKEVFMVVEAKDHRETIACNISIRSWQSVHKIRFALIDVVGATSGVLDQDGASAAFVAIGAW